MNNIFPLLILCLFFVCPFFYCHVFCFCVWCPCMMCVIFVVIVNFCWCCCYWWCGNVFVVLMSVILKLWVMLLRCGHFCSMGPTMAPKYSVCFLVQQEIMDQSDNGIWEQEKKNFLSIPGTWREIIYFSSNTRIYGTLTRKNNFS